MIDEAPIYRLVPTIEMNEPVQEDYLLEDLQHVSSLIEQGCHMGEIDVSTPENLGWRQENLEPDVVGGGMTPEEQGIGIDGVWVIILGGLADDIAVEAPDRED